MADTITGIDVGGTFTDFAILRDGALTVHKLPSTPADPSKSIIQGIEELGVGASSFVHGSTVATNALLERKGARTALVTTMGFEDVLEIGRQSRSDLYDLDLDRPPPLVPTDLRFGLKERVDYTGAPLDSPSREGPGGPGLGYRGSGGGRGGRFPSLLLPESPARGDASGDSGGVT